jgi:hypothetical protein
MIDITTDSILAYIGYGVKHLVAVPDNNKLFTATYTPLDSDEQIPCFVEISDTETKIITSAYYTTNGNKVNIEGTSIANVSKRVSGVTNDLALGDIVEIDESNTILYAIKDSSINNIPTTINALSIQELFTSDIYGVSTPYTVVASDATVNDGEINFNTDYLYYIKDTETGKFVLINNNATDGSRGKFAVGTEFPTDQTYYTYGKPTGTWKFMLYKTVTIKSAEPDVPDIVYSGEQTYSVNSMNSLMSNVTANINTATISDLQEAGIIGKDVKIDQDIPVIKDTANKIFYTKQAKNCTIDDILGSVDYLTSQDYALALLKKTNSALYPDAYDILPATTSGD